MSCSRSPGQNLGSGAGMLATTALFTLLNPTLIVGKGDVVEGVVFSFPVVDPKTPTRRRLFRSLLTGEEASIPTAGFPLGDKAVVVRLVEGEGEGGNEEFGIGSFGSASSEEDRGVDDRVPSPWIRALNFLFVAFMARYLVGKWVV